MNYILARLREPSTRLAIAGILTTVAPLVPAYAVVMQGVAALIAGHAIVTPDPK